MSSHGGPTPEAAPTRRRGWFRTVARLVERALAIFGLVVLVYWNCFDVSIMVSGSMAPTLVGENWRSGDRVLTERVSYWFRRPRRWEVISFRMNDGVRVMKRVVGLPGERVQMTREGQVVIDGQPVPRPEWLQPVRYLACGNIVANQVAECGQGYYVLGDDSRDSADSRFDGPVPPRQITGRAWLILSPAAHRGFVR